MYMLELEADGAVLGGYPMNITTIFTFALEFSCMWARLGNKDNEATGNSMWEKRNLRGQSRFQEPEE